MDILVIGNGFDLAHGLKTSYKDFLEACHKMSLQEAVDGEADYKKLCDTNLWMKHFITRQKQLGDTWIDLENEIYNVICIMNRHPTAINSGMCSLFCPQILTIERTDNSFTFNQLNDNYLKQPPNTELRPTNNYEILTTSKDTVFKVYFAKSEFFIKFLYDQLRDFTKAFERYLLNEVMDKLVRNDEYILSLNDDISTRKTTLYVLSFNYTDTCFKLYDHSRNPYSKYNIKTIYIHGKALHDDNCELVLGTHSFKSSKEYGSISPNFNIFKKHYQRHKYGTIETYQALLKELTTLKQDINFHIIGHSLEETDHKVLGHILTINKNATIKIYYHNEYAQEKLMRNINEIIGEDEVMTRVQFIDQHDKKRGILIPTTHLVQSAS